MVEERFLYEIHPHRPIKNLIPGKALVKPVSMKLTKPEVLICMAGGPVFRLFPGKDPIRVVGSNLNQLHVSKFEEYEKSTKSPNQTINAENDTRATEVVSEEPKIEAPTTPVVEENPIDPKTEEITDPDPIPVVVEPGPVIIEEEPKEEEPIPVPLEPGPVIIEEKKEEEPVPVVVEPGPVIIEETVEESSEEDDSEEEEETTDEEQKLSSSVNPVTVNLSNKKHKKNRH